MNFHDERNRISYTTRIADGLWLSMIKKYIDVPRETRQIYDDIDALRNDLLQRTGRSILHELSDYELHELILFIKRKLENTATPIIEKDSWTLWFAIKK